MPNADRVALAVTEAVVGPQVWQYDVCETMPDEAYERTRLAAVALLEQIVRVIDWPRLLGDAEWRHHKLHPDTRVKVPGGWQPSTQDTCGECLREALLAHGFAGHAQNWTAQPEVLRRGQRVDWPRVFADAITYRRETRPSASAYRAARGA